MKQEKNSAQTKSNILKAAEDEFSDKGFYGARIDQIALMAGINKSMIYQYFGNKEQLYEIVLEKVYARLQDFEMKIIQEHGSWEQSILKLVKTYFEFLYDNPSYVRMLMWENLNYGKHFNKEQLVQSKNPIREELERILSLGKNAGTINPMICEQDVLQTLIACSFNYFSNAYTLGHVLKRNFMTKDEIEKRVKEVSQMILSYVKT